MRKTVYVHCITFRMCSVYKSRKLRDLETENDFQQISRLFSFLLDVYVTGLQDGVLTGL